MVRVKTDVAPASLRPVIVQVPVPVPALTVSPGPHTVPEADPSYAYTYCDVQLTFVLVTLAAFQQS